RRYRVMSDERWHEEGDAAPEQETGNGEQRNGEQQTGFAGAPSRRDHTPSRSRRRGQRRRKRRDSLLPAQEKVGWWSTPAILPLLLLVITLPFGSVHPRPQALAVLLVSFLAIGFVASLKNRPRAHGSHHALSFFLVGFLLIGLYGAGHSVLTTVGSDAPLGGTFSRNLLPEYWEHFIPGYALILGTFLITFFGLSQRKSEAKRPLWSSSESLLFRTERRLLLVGIVVSLIALSHWLTDNGKLFWIFSPLSSGLSHRARWPFVNPNHLAFFLLPFFFLSLVATARQLLETVHFFDRSSRSRQSREKLAELLGRQEVQHLFGSLTIASLASTLFAVTLLATLSRASWLGASVGVIVFGVLALRAIFDYENQLLSLGHHSSVGHRSPSQHGEELSQDREPGSGHPREETLAIDQTGRTRLSLTLGIFFLSLLGVFTVFLLSLGEGQGRIGSRMVSGLISSRDDMRWILFVDSLELLSPFGVGIHRWNEIYATMLPAGLAGLNPYYLHSEPLQLAIELGVVGFLLVAAVFLTPITSLILETRELITRTQPRYRNEVEELYRIRFENAAMVSIWCAITIALCFDFSLRIPANLVLLGALCALTFAQREKTSTLKRRLLGLSDVE
ncbi:O-antigen ligase family protein, partial [bacterium]|nr:O-antigen ligase family protein [bacterium]